MTKYILAFMAFFAIMNPISNLPVFIAMVADDDQKISREIAAKGIIVAFFIITVFTLLGHVIFQLFGITIGALKIAGGILISIIGYHMINGNHSPTNKNIESNPGDPMDIAISPLATPLLAGPGTISTAISFSAGGISQQIMTLMAFASLCLITYLLLISAKEITEFLGKNAMTVITRLMGLILTTIGVQMLIAGVKLAFHLS